MPARSFTASNDYRYGFNGKEKDNNISSLTAYDYGFRIYDPRIARFKSVDRLAGTYPYYTPYQFAGNMPLAAIDLDGLEQYVVIYNKDQAGKNSRVSIYAMTDNQNNVLNQNVQQVIHNQRDGNNVAKGNVLVFEIYNAGTRNEQMKIVDKRNTPDSKLTAEEEKVFKENRKQYDESSGFQFFGYADKSNPQYQSQNFLTSQTNAFEASKAIVRTRFSLNASFKSYTTDLNNKSSLTTQLQNTVQYLKENPDKVLEIYGNVGCSDPNLNCATAMTLDGKANVPVDQAMKQRAQAVADILIKMGVDPKQLKPKVGKTVPISTTSTTVPIDFKINKRK